MIRYTETIPLRIERRDAPQFPFWQATSIGPYSARRSEPISIEYASLLATPGRSEVSFTNDIADQLQRQKRLSPPLLIDATEAAERLYARGAAALDFAQASQLETLLLLSTDGSVPPSPPQASDSTAIALCAWPADEELLERHCRQLKDGAFQWGMVIPIFFPVMTDLPLLERLSDLAARHGARFLAAIPIDLDAQARSSLAQTLIDHADYEALFHSDLEPVTIATERHVAALAEARGMFDHVRLPRAADRNNWNASVLLALAGNRLLRLHPDSELGWDLLRSSRVVAQLKKSLVRIAEAASLSIIEGVDDLAARSLEAWIRGEEPEGLTAIDEDWRQFR